MAEASYSTESDWARLRETLHTQTALLSRRTETTTRLVDELRVADSIVQREAQQPLRGLLPNEPMTALLVTGHDFDPVEAVWMLTRFNAAVEWVLTEYLSGTARSRLAIGEWCRRGDGLIPPPQPSLPVNADWQAQGGYSPEYFQQHYFRDTETGLVWVAPDPTVSVSAELFDVVPTTCAAMMVQAQTSLNALQRLTTYLTVTLSAINRLLTCPLARHPVAIHTFAQALSPGCALHLELVTLLQGVIAFTRCLKP